MGLFDKIKDNAKNISMRAIDGTDSYDEDERFEYYQQPTQEVATEAVTADATVIVPTDISEDVEFIEDNTDSESSAPENSDQAKSETETDKSEDKKPRKSKVTEISKAEHEKAEKEKRQTKAKQEAKERLAKSYVPSYKAKSTKSEKKADTKSSSKSDDNDTKVAKPVTQRRSIGIIDVTPNRFQTPAKGAVYARERVAMNIIASQRKLNGTVALYTASHMNFKTRVFIDRIEYSGSFGKTVIPIEKVAWIKLRFGGTGIIVETIEGKRVVMVVKPSDRLAFTDAVLKVQSLQPKKAKFKDKKTVRIDQLDKISEGIDEIEKLAKLFDKGILSQEEFDTKKKQILGL